MRRRHKHDYRLLVEEMPLATYISALDSPSYALYVSPGIVDLLGYSRAEWHENPRLFVDILHPDDRERVLDLATEAKSAGRPYEADYRLLHRDGRVVWVEDRAVTVSDERGRRLHWQGYLVDVTARKEAEARYQTLVEQLPLITYVDPPEKTRQTASYISPQAETMLGYSVEEWAEDPDFFAQHLHPADRERVLDAQRAARISGEPLTIEYRFLAKDGRIVWLQDIFTMVHDETGQRLYSQGFALDVTARKLAERDREELLRRERVRNKELRELDRMKSEFVALVSHELRTPLTSIRGYLELLLDDAESEELSQSQRDFLGVVDRNSERLMRLVEDLLLAAQAEAGSLQLTMEDVDLARLVNDAVSACAPAAATRDIELVAIGAGAPVIRADQGRLGQVLDNLVANALKFTPPGGRVEVRALAADGGARIEVADTGVGIPAAEQRHLFSRFFRTERAHRDAVAGAGLGLSIAKALVEAHGGTITVASEEGRGTTFRVDLPRAGVEAATPAA